MKEKIGNGHFILKDGIKVYAVTDTSLWDFILSTVVPNKGMFKGFLWDGVYLSSSTQKTSFLWDGKYTEVRMKPIDGFAVIN